MYPRRIAEELQARGHDAISVHDAPGAGTADEAVFDQARSEHRAAATKHTRNYRPLADAILEAGDARSGLILMTARRWPRRPDGPAPPSPTISRASN